jgi:uncharacterized lipoprotein YbaY
MVHAVDIAGLITFRDPPDDLSDATIHVRLLDTTLADAPSKTIREVTVAGDVAGDATLTDTAGGIPFSFHATHLDSRCRYEISVHVDRGATGEVTTGDYLTTVSHPVAADSQSRDLRITVDPI